MKRRGRQRGVALLALIAVLVIGGTWYHLSRLQQLSANRTATERVRNAEVLNRAKQALIGYVIAQANHAGENNPGALPCPEAPTAFNSTTGTDGKVASSCTLPAAGRFPWRTIGTDKLVDAAGEPLWYVVSAGWAVTCGGCTTTINSNSAGQLTVDGVAPGSLATADTVIALIIAPGLPFSVPAATGCTAYSQARPQTSGSAPDVRNYLECDNATSGDSSFVTTGPSGSFNDQVLKVTVGDLMPGLEASIANRIEREIAPQLKTVYNSNTWATNVSATNPVYPYPAGATPPSTGLLANPGTTASFQGSSASCSASVCAGLLPVIFTNNPGASTLCTSGGTSLCDPTFVKWASGTIEVKSLTISGINYVPGTYGGITWTATVTNCTVSTVGSPQYSELDCNANIPALAGIVTTSVIYEVRGVASNVGMALRRFDSAASLPGITVTTAPSVSMASTGSATTTFQGSTNAPTTATVVANALCGLVGAGIQCRQVTITVPLPPLFPDHALLNSNDATTGWFMRNEWYRSTYYAVAPGYTPSVLPSQPSCTPGTNCLTVSNITPTGGQRALLILAGRSLNASATTLGAATNAAQTTLSVASATGFPGASFGIIIDAEIMQVTAVSGVTFTVTRAQQGTTATTHSSGAIVRQYRPSTTIADYLEFANASATGTATAPFERQTVVNQAPYAYADTGGLNAYAISLSTVQVGVPIHFKAANTNTGASTLNTTATGVKNIVNSDGSALSASQIRAYAVVQVVYDGTKFVLNKRPFNDRVVVIDSN